MVAEHQVAFFLRELDSPDPARRAAAAKGLSRAPGHAGELLALVTDPAPEVRAAAALGLGRQRAAVPAEPLVALCSDPDAEVRRRAVNTLVQLGASGPEVTAAFAGLVEDAGLRNRTVVLEWLLQAEAPVPAASLVPLLGHRDDLIWARARFLLRLLPEADAVFADLARTASGRVRHIALDMLDTPKAGVPGLGYGAPEEVHVAAWKRFWEPEPRVVRALLAALAEETEPRARHNLFRALAGHRVPDAVGPAAAWLDDPACGPAAASALGAAGTTEAIDVLRRFAAGRHDAALRREALRALGAAGGIAEAEWLYGLLGARSEPVRLGAAAGLAAFFERAGDSLLGRLERWRAGRVPGVPAPPAEDAVRELARRSAVRLVRELIADVENADAYHSALWSIPEVRPMLPQLLEHRVGRVRATALYLARKFGGIDLATKLRFLDDPHLPVRSEVVSDLRSLAGSPDLSPADRRAVRAGLERARDDEDSFVRDWAADALARLDRSAAGRTA